MFDPRSRGPVTGPVGTTDMQARVSAETAYDATVPTGGIVADLPAPGSVAVGTRAYVTDATAPAFLAIVAGGGAVFTPVVSDGTNWRCG